MSNLALQPRPGAVSVMAMAKMIGLSRSSFHGYIRRGVFPPPVYSLVNKRPLYVPEQQATVLAIRRTGIGHNGEIVVFYERNPEGSSMPTPKVAKATTTKPIPPAPLSGLIDSLRSLGLTVTPGRVQAVVTQLFPSGTDEIDGGDLVRAVYRHLRQSGAGET